MTYPLLQLYVLVGLLTLLWAFVEIDVVGDFQRLFEDFGYSPRGPGDYRVLLSELIVLVVSGVVCTVLLLVAWPAFWVATYLDKRKKQRPVEPYVPDYKENSIRAQLGGSGVLNCGSCRYFCELTLSIHGFGPNSKSVSGYQCDSCAALLELTGNQASYVPHVANTLPRDFYQCLCGGEFSKKHNLKCPSCKSNNVRYSIRYMT